MFSQYCLPHLSALRSYNLFGVHAGIILFLVASSRFLGLSGFHFTHQEKFAFGRGSENGQPGFANNKNPCQELDKTAVSQPAIFVASMVRRFPR